MSALIATTVFAAVPKAPSSFCVNNQCAADAAPAAALKMKWHPGHYMWLDGNRTSPELIAQHFKQIDAIANEPSVRGIKLVLYWGAVEKDQGDYSAGFAIIDSYLQKLAATNKYLILSIQDRLFGGYDPAQLAAYFPPYVTKAYGITKMRNGTTLRVWQQATMDRQIALAKALAARYDGNPNLEMYQVEETSISVPEGTDGYSVAAYSEQLKRLVAASRSAWTRTVVRLPTNFLGSDSTMADLIAYCNSQRVAVGGPDIIPNQTIQADRIFMGSGGKDYRGLIPWVAEVQSPSLGGHEGTFTPKALYDSGMMRSPSHFVWYRNTFAGGTAQKWDTGILPFIKSVKGVVIPGCPSAFSDSCAS